MFANQNSACKLRNRFTIERLTDRFSLFALEDEKQNITVEFPLAIKAQHKGETFAGSC